MCESDNESENNSSAHISVFEQRAYIKIETIRGKTVPEIHAALNEVCGTDTVDRSTVQRWHQRFRDGRTSIDNNPRSGRPSTVTQDNTNAAILATLLDEDRRITVREIEQETGISKSSVHRILTEILQKRKIAARWVPHFLSPEQKDTRKDICRELLSRYENEKETFLDRIIAIDETWIRDFEPELKSQSNIWKGITSPRAKKVRRQQTKVKQMMIFAYDKLGIIVTDRVPIGSSVTGDYYKTFLAKKLRPEIRKKRPGMLQNGVSILHDNARPHIGAPVVALLEKYGWERLYQLTANCALLLGQPSYIFPCSEQLRGGKLKKRSPSFVHLKQFHWLVMSNVAHELFCKYCFIFASYNNCLQNLVIKPLQKFSKLTGKDGVLSVHNNNKYHLNAVRAGKDFLKTYSCPKKQVINQISTHRLEQVKENRERLRPIIETLIFCGQQNIAIRGHRDDGKLIDIDNSESSPTSNEGNFRELLRLRIRAGDVSLKKHLENTSSRATYIGKNIQNELLDCIGSVIKSQIVKNVQNSGYYSIMFDETSDISCVEQLSLTLRYVINNEIHEDFVCFLDAYRSIRTNDVLASGETKLTGVALGHIVLDILTKDLGLDLKRCVGVATDGCAVMVSEDCGAVTTIKKECSIAVYCPCYNHALNNSLAQTSKIVPIRNTIGTLKEIIAFFNASAKRHLVIEALTDISYWADRISSSKASILLAAICNSDFVISLLSTADILKLTLPVSRLLQSSSLDFTNALSAIEGIKEIFQEKRTLCVGEFRKIFLEASSLAEEIGCEIKMPRRAKTQIHHNNYLATDAEQFYLHTLEAFDLRLLMPNIIVKLNDIDGWDQQRISVRIIAVAKKFSPLFTVSENLMVDMLEGEISLWLHKWKQQPINERPCTALESYMQCDEDMFPTIKTLMQVLATLPHIHPSQLSEFNKCGKKRNIIDDDPAAYKQLKIDEVGKISKKLNETEFDKANIELIVSTVSPFSLIEHP
ncbi:hypothetical protein QTP88_028538 [Uroleucon formosanum]